MASCGTDEWLAAEASSADLPEIAALVNSAYRGESAERGWTHEAGLLGGQRTDPQTLADDLASPGRSTILCLRRTAGGPILACVFLQRTIAPDGGTRCYLGMLSVSPELQNSGLGRALLARAEAHAQIWGVARITMTVIHCRDTLIVWYERRGYRRTGETRPFPYGDARFGEPRRSDLYFVVLEKPL